MLVHPHDRNRGNNMMTGDTILVIDADLATEDKIVSTLEAEGYIVFASSGSKINADMAKKFRLP